MLKSQTGGAIYVVEMCAPSFPRPIKIGTTSSTRSDAITNRIEGILTSSPYPIRLLAIWQRREGDPTETQLHGLYQDYRINGEWFLLHPRSEQGLLSRSEQHPLIGRAWFTTSMAHVRFHSVVDQVRADLAGEMKETHLRKRAISISPTIENESQKPERLAWRLQDLALAIGLSVPFLRKEIRENRLAAIKTGSAVIVLNSDLQVYLSRIKLSKRTSKSPE